MRMVKDISTEKNGIGYRCAGVLLPVSALPSDDGFGTFSSAYRFIDFLRDAGQSVWQILPLNPIDEVGSPYNSSAAFAIDPLYADAGHMERVPLDKPNREYFKLLRKKRMERLHDIFCRTENRLDAKLFKFAQKNSFWIWDYCMFQALSERFSNDSFRDWPEGIKAHDPRDVKRYSNELSASIRFNLFLQYTAHTEWQRVRRYAHRAGISILGDMPFYVAKNSADVWAHEQQFDTALSGGVPPDYFSELGQKWNTPVYDWEKMRRDGYLWWRERVKRSYALYDIIRIDHFRAIESFYAIDTEAADARGGSWLPGPGYELIDAILRCSRRPRFIAEDLGTITPEVRKLLDMSGFPGMSVLQFAFDGNDDNPHLPFSVSKNRVLYTGTHDNQTLRGWLNGLDDDTRLRVYDYFGVSESSSDAVFDIIDAAMASRAGIFIAPMQDYLGLSDEHRINTPGDTEGNWRFSLDAFPNDELADRMRSLVKKHNRLRRRFSLW